MDPINIVYFLQGYSHKIIACCTLAAFITLGCAKKDDTTTGATTSSSSTKCSSSSAVAGCVGDNSSNKVTTALAKSSKFSKGLTVFGINLLATSGVEDAKLLHAANVAAELFDNDENGTVDNAAVVYKLVSLSAAITMYKSDSTEFDTSPLTAVGWSNKYSTGLGADETRVNYASGTDHDASIEEIFHLITQNGYSNVYPTAFEESNTSTSLMAKAMDVARGSSTAQRCDTTPCTWTYNNTDCTTAGSVDNASNDKAWYFYNDSTADYATM